MNPEIGKWLFTATHGLATQEIERIKADVQEHFADACLVYQEKGLTTAEAEARALVDLGNANTANQKYRTVYFTEEDNDRIQRLLKRSWWTYFSIFITPASLFLIIWQYPELTKIERFDVLWSLILKLVLSLGYLFEPAIKRWVYRQSPRFGLLFAQGVMVVLVSDLLKTTLENAFDLFSGNLTMSSKYFDWIIVAGLVYLWLKSQLPLTIKAIRRLRA